MVNSGQVLAVHNVPSTYMVPGVLEEQGLVRSMTTLLHLSPEPVAMEKGAAMWSLWKTATALGSHPDTVTIALVGKYTSFLDSYMSLVRALEHSAMACKRKLNLVLVDSSHLESGNEGQEKAWQLVRSAGGILVPGGFGSRGTEGMIEAIRYARESKTPFLGICLGMQLAVVEYARNVCDRPNATSAEFDDNATDPVIINMPELDRVKMGGTMRLGLRPTHFQPGSGWSQIRRLYAASSHQMKGESMHWVDGPQSSEAGEMVIHERHRHRYEVNPACISALEDQGLQFIAKDDKAERMEILELRDHPWFVGVQFHPEYISKVLKPSRPILGFLAASAGCLS